MWRPQPRFQHSRDRRRVAGLSADREESIGQRYALAGMVENLPITQLAPRAERDVACADTAERKGHRPGAGWECARLAQRFYHGRCSWLLARVSRFKTKNVKRKG